MTIEEKYLSVLKALGQAIAEQEIDINMKEWTIKELKQKITKLEEEAKKEDGNTL